jgi:cytochrome c-type protein NapC
MQGDRPGHKDLVPGKTYTLGFALHEDHAATRFHQVSWEFTMALDGGKADFIAGRH